MRINFGHFGNSTWIDQAKSAIAGDGAAAAASDAWNSAKDTMAESGGSLYDTAASKVGSSGNQILDEVNKMGAGIIDQDALAREHGAAVGEAAAADLWKKAQPVVWIGMGLLAVAVLGVVMGARKKR